MKILPFVAQKSCILSFFNLTISFFYVQYDKIKAWLNSTMWEVGVLLCGSIADLSWWVFA
jgi:hypothetical protein